MHKIYKKGVFIVDEHVPNWEGDMFQNQFVKHNYQIIALVQFFNKLKILKMKI